MSECDTVGGVPVDGPDSTSAVLAFGDNALTSSTTDRVLSPWYTDTVSESDLVQNARIVVPRAGTLKNLRVHQGNGNGNGNDIVYTVRVNGVASALTVTIASTANDASDLVNTVAVVAGDEIDVLVEKALTIAGSPNNITATMEFAS